MSATPKHPKSSDGTALIRCTAWLGCLGLAIVSSCIFLNGIQFSKHLISNRLSAQESSHRGIGVLEVFGRLVAIGAPSLLKATALLVMNVLSNLQRHGPEFVAGDDMNAPEIVTDSGRHFLAQEGNLPAEQATPFARFRAYLNSLTNENADDASNQAAENRAYHIIVPALWGIIGLLIGMWTNAAGKPRRPQDNHRATI